MTIKKITIAEYDPEVILKLIRTKHKRQFEFWFHVAGKTYVPKRTSQRYVVFSKNTKCVACGIEGTIMALEMWEDQKVPHLNLYGVTEEGEYILMTKDHIKPKAKKGRNIQQNYQTMCQPCNNRKADK